MSNQVTPWFVVAKIWPTLELMTISWPLTGLTAKLAPPVNGHCGSGVGQAAAGLEQAEGPADAVDLEEVGVVAAAAGPEVLVEVPCPAGRWPRRWRRRRARSSDVAVGQDVGVGDRPAVVLGAAVEQGAGDLGGRAAGLGRAVVELGDLDVAVAVDAGRRIGGPDLGLERPVVVQDAPDPLVVAEDQPGRPVVGSIIVTTRW